MPKKPGRTTTTTTKYKRKHVNTKRAKPKKNTTRNTKRHTTVKKHIYSIKNRKTVGGRSYPSFTPTEIDYLTTQLGFSTEHIDYLNRRRKDGTNITPRMLDNFVQRYGKTPEEVIDLMKEGEETDNEFSDEDEEDL